MREPAQDDRASPAWLAFALRWVSWAAVGIALILVAAFVELSEELLDPEERSTPLLGANAAVLRFVATFRRPWLNGVAMDLTALGSPIVVALFTVVLGAILLVKADRRGATTLVATSFAAPLADAATKRLLERPRPDLVPRLVEVTGLSYSRLLGAGFAAFIVLLIGASRVYLSVHYPSDVLGGALIGTALALLMAGVLRRLDRSAPVERVADSVQRTAADQ